MDGKDADISAFYMNGTIHKNLDAYLTVQFS